MHATALLVVISSAGLSLVQYRELLGNRRINELSLRFRVGSLPILFMAELLVPSVR